MRLPTASRRSLRRLRPILTTLALAPLLAACVPNRISYFYEDKLALVPDLAICADYHLYRTDPDRYGHLSDYARDQLESHLQAQDAIAEELTAIRHLELRQGMSECSLLAAWGKPDFQAQTRDRLAEWTRYDYHPAPTGRSTRVYLSRGRVVRWEPISSPFRDHAAAVQASP